MQTKILPIAVVSMALLAACCDDESSASVKVSPETSVEDDVPEVFSQERDFDVKCNRSNGKTLVDRVSFESFYSVSDKKGSVKVSVFYEQGIANENAVELCETFAKKFDFEDYVCIEGMETDSLHSSIKKETSVAEDDFDGYVEFLCGNVEE